MGGTAFEVIYTFIILLIGFLSLAMALQGADFINPKISMSRRILFAAVALILLLPVPKWTHLVALGIMAAGWVPGFLAYRKSPTTANI